MPTLPPSAFTDDRGKPAQARPGAEMVSNITGRELSEVERLTALVANVLPILAPVSVVAYVVLMGGGRGSNVERVVGTSICPGGAFFILALGVRGLVLRTVRPLAGVRLSLPTMMSHGYCGACGYRIADALRQPDGCLVCAECGSAWHADRVTFPEAAVPVTVAALRNAGLGIGAPGRLKATSAIGYLDDRKVGLPAVYCWPRGVFRSNTPPHAIEAKKALNRSLGLGVLMFLTLSWIAGAVLAMSFWRSTYSWTDRLTSTLIIAGVCGVFHLLVRMAKLQSDQTRAIVLQHGLCPSCWSPIQDRVEFDGCRRCAGEACKAAWNAADIAAARQTASPPPLPPS